jgi:hypothetical protein
MPDSRNNRQAVGAATVAHLLAGPLQLAVVVRLLTWGLVGGAVAGAVVGLVIGLRTYLLTAPFALVEGAVLGSVGAAVLALLLAGLAVLPALWHRP